MHHVTAQAFFRSILPGVIARIDPQARTPLLLLVGGLSRSGKTVLSERIVAEASRHHLEALRLSLDHWIVDFEKRPVQGSVRERYETAAICTSVQRLLAGQAIYPPVYDARSRRRVAEEGPCALSPPRHLLVVEGVLALDLARLREHAAWRIYVQTDAALRRERLQLFYQAKGLSESQIAALLCSREMDETPIVEQSHQYADLLVQM